MARPSISHVYVTAIFVQPYIYIPCIFVSMPTPPGAPCAPRAGLMINLFNLLPIGDLDGGRIGKAISPAVAVGGLGIGGLMLYHGVVSSPLFYIIMLAGTYSTGSRLLGYDQMPQGYYDIPLRTKAGVSGAYLALIAALLYAMQVNNRHRKTPRQLKAEKEGVFLPEAHGHRDGVYDDFFADEQPGEERW